MAVAPTIAFGGLKGGSGKSTLAANVAGALAAEGRRVVVIDCDAQGTAAAWLSGSPVAVEADALDDGRELGAWLGRVNQRRLEADVVILDLPPHLREQTVAALVVAELVVLPVRASLPDLLALRQAVELVREAREARRSGLPAALVVPSAIDVRRAVDREIGEALAELGEPVGPAIGSRSAFVESFGSWVGAVAPGSKAHQEIEALAEAIRRVKL